MTLSFTVPAEYPWVILTAVGFLWLNAYQTFNVLKYRKSAKIEYPQCELLVLRHLEAERLADVTCEVYAEQSEVTKTFVRLSLFIWQPNSLTEFLLATIGGQEIQLRPKSVVFSNPPGL